MSPLEQAKKEAAEAKARNATPTPTPALSPLEQAKKEAAEAKARKAAPTPEPTPEPVATPPKAEAPKAPPKAKAPPVSVPVASVPTPPKAKAPAAPPKEYGPTDPEYYLEQSRKLNEQLAQAQKAKPVAASIPNPFLEGIKPEPIKVPPPVQGIDETEQSYKARYEAWKAKDDPVVQERARNIYAAPDFQRSIQNEGDIQDSAVNNRIRYLMKKDGIDPSTASAEAQKKYRLQAEREFAYLRTAGLWMAPVVSDVVGPYGPRREVVGVDRFGNILYSEQGAGSYLVDVTNIPATAAAYTVEAALPETAFKGGEKPHASLDEAIREKGGFMALEPHIVEMGFTGETAFRKGVALALDVAIPDPLSIAGMGVDALKAAPRVAEAVAKGVGVAADVARATRVGERVADIAAPVVRAMEPSLRAVEEAADVARKAGGDVVEKLATAARKLPGPTATKMGAILKADEALRGLELAGKSVDPQALSTVDQAIQALPTGLKQEVEVKIVDSFSRKIDKKIADTPIPKDSRNPSPWVEVKEAFKKASATTPQDVIKVLNREFPASSTPFNASVRKEFLSTVATDSRGLIDTLDVIKTRVLERVVPETATQAEKVAAIETNVLRKSISRGSLDNAINMVKRFVSGAFVGGSSTLELETQGIGKALQKPFRETMRTIESALNDITRLKVENRAGFEKFLEETGRLEDYNRLTIERRMSAIRKAAAGLPPDEEAKVLQQIDNILNEHMRESAEIAKEFTKQTPTAKASPVKEPEPIAMPGSRSEELDLAYKGQRIEDKTIQSLGEAEASRPLEKEAAQVRKGLQTIPGDQPFTAGRGRYESIEDIEQRLLQSPKQAGELPPVKSGEAKLTEPVEGQQRLFNMPKEAPAPVLLTEPYAPAEVKVGDSPPVEWVNKSEQSIKSRSEQIQRLYNDMQYRQYQDDYGALMDAQSLEFLEKEGDWLADSENAIRPVRERIQSLMNQISETDPKFFSRYALAATAQIEEYRLANRIGQEVYGLTADEFNVLKRIAGPSAADVSGEGIKDLPIYMRPILRDMIGNAEQRALVAAAWQSRHGKFYIPKVLSEKLDDLTKSLLSSSKGQPIFRTLLGYWSTSVTRGNLALKPGYFLNNAIGNVEQIWVESLQLGRIGRMELTGKKVIQEAGLLGIPVAVGAAQGAASMLAGHIGQMLPTALLSALRKTEIGKNIISTLVDITDVSRLFDIPVTKILEQSSDVVKGASGKTYRELYEIAARKGVLEGFDTTEVVNLLKRTERGSLDKAGDYMPAASIAEIAEVIGTRQRLGLYSLLIAAGKNPEEAAELTVKALYDYRFSVTEGEKSAIVKVVAPFWRWQKNANAQFLRSMLSWRSSRRMSAFMKGRVGVRDILDSIYTEDYDEYGVNTGVMTPDEQKQYAALKSFLLWYQAGAEGSELEHPAELSNDEINRIIVEYNSTVAGTKSPFNEFYPELREGFLVARKYARNFRFDNIYRDGMAARYALATKEGKPVDQSDVWVVAIPPSGMEGAMRWCMGMAMTAGSLVPTGMGADVMVQGAARAFTDNVVDPDRLPFISVGLKGFTDSRIQRIKISEGLYSAMNATPFLTSFVGKVEGKPYIIGAPAIVAYQALGFDALDRRLMLVEQGAGMGTLSYPGSIRVSTGAENQYDIREAGTLDVAGSKADE